MRRGPLEKDRASLWEVLGAGSAAAPLFSCAAKVAIDGATTAVARLPWHYEGLGNARPCRHLYLVPYQVQNVGSNKEMPVYEALC
jgi:hypothetical protein